MATDRARDYRCGTGRPDQKEGRSDRPAEACPHEIRENAVLATESFDAPKLRRPNLDGCAPPSKK